GWRGRRGPPVAARTGLGNAWATRRSPFAPAVAASASSRSKPRSRNIWTASSRVRCRGMSVGGGGASGRSPARTGGAAHTSNKTDRHTWNRKRALLITPVHGGNERARPAWDLGARRTETTSGTAPREFGREGL